MEMKEYFDNLIALTENMGGYSTEVQVETEDGHIITIQVRKKKK